jgi:hypothetical protein
MDFWFEFLNIHIKEKIITCYDCYGFKKDNCEYLWFFNPSSPFFVEKFDKCLISQNWKKNPKTYAIKKFKLLINTTTYRCKY